MVKRSVLPLLLLFASLAPLSRASAQESKEVSELRAEVDKLRAIVERLERSVAKHDKSPLQDLRFTGIYVAPDGKRSLAEFSTNGPLAATFKPIPSDITKVVVDSKNGKIYGRVNHRVFGASTEDLKFEEMPPGQPEFSWLSAIAFDTKRNRLLASTFGGGGLLYAYDFKAEKWEEIANPGLSASALAYAESEDILYGLNLAIAPKDYLSKLTLFNEKGVKIAERELSEQIPTGGDWGKTQLIYSDGWLIVLHDQEDHGSSARENRRARPLQRGYLIDPKSAEVVYSWDNRPQ